MEAEVGAQVAASMFLHQSLPGRLCEAPPVARKRDWTRLNPNFNYNHHQHQQKQSDQQQLIGSGFQNPNGGWNSSLWNWDSNGFIARPSSDSSDGVLSLGRPVTEVTQKKKGEESFGEVILSKGRQEDGENLTLKLGGSSYSVEEAMVKPNKRPRSGSPGIGGNHPMCQVDDCKADLSNGKDYHRRHKVCEVHSKTTKAFVGKQMQRFCQQCSRFHPLSEFDEGKRSCRRRLAGHNRRRRKTQLEDASSKNLHPANRETSGSGTLDVVKLLGLLARFQGQSAYQMSSSSLPDRDQLIQMISEKNSFPASNCPVKLPERGGINLNVSETSQPSLENPPRTNASPSALSAIDLLAVLSRAMKVSPINPVAPLTQGSSHSSCEDKTRINCLEPAADVNSQNKATPTFLPMPVERSICTAQSSIDVSEHPVQEACPSLPFQLFSSTEDDSPPKMGSERKYLSSESSNPMEERSPSSSPVVHNLFPLHSTVESLKHGRISICRDDNAMVEISTSRGHVPPMEFSKASERRPGNHINQGIAHQAGYTSSSGSDHSPSSSNSDNQDRTGRIIFKLFGKNPSDLPGSLRKQIFTWLSRSPSDIESYIRPGCVVLSVYVSMPSSSWNELQEDLVQRVKLLLEWSDSDFWRGRFLVYTDRQLASHKDGKIRLCKCWRTWNAPELVSVSPLAVVSGKEASLFLRGRNLTVPGTKIHCTYMGGYTSKEVLGSAYPGTIYDNSCSESFIFPGGAPNVFGRCFIEVENGFKGNSFPVIVADDRICQELRALESEMEEDPGVTEAMEEDQVQDYLQPRSRDNVLHFLNELGWLFQRKNMQSIPFSMCFSNTRFKFLFTFSVERDWPAVIKVLLDILVEKSSGKDGLLQESLEMLSEIQLLNRAIKRRCRKMVDLLVQYSVSNEVDLTRVYLFPPNVIGPGGLTPLHLAASTQDSEDMIDALTNDPQEIGLNTWSSVLDDNGQSPYAYALMRNNHSYNRLVARKLADRQNCQVSVTIESEEMTLDKSWILREPEKSSVLSLQVPSCSQCALMETRRMRSTLRTGGLLQRPYVHSMLAIAAVCVCVCLFLRGAPQLGSVAPFKWENLEFGTS